jgi:hypothetical protein
MFRMRTLARIAEAVWFPESAACNECGAVAATITREQLEAGYVPEELRFDGLTTALCPHCGAVRVFPGFRAIDAFICAECGQVVGVERPIQ